ncbi:MAG: hypothetical protein A2020_12915 [Lentisphaerae bacterium GWF2_45_14]|nr:MAG: hypothetical protein A2020_12915 [Lentisphaerae bacterium GWF2_45_14]
MNKSLTPLILILGAVLLMSIIIVNTRYAESSSSSTVYTIPSQLELSPFSRSRKTTTAAQNKNRIPNSSELKVDTSAIFVEAQTLLKKGDPESAEDRLRTLLIFEPENLPALNILGEILYRSRKYRDAEFVFRKQLAINPRESNVYNNLSSALAKQNKFDEAVKTAEEGLKIMPDSTPILLNLSGMYSVMGEKKISVEYFKRVYEKIGSDILQISGDPTLKNIHDEPGFISIVKKAEEKSAKKASPQNRF